MSTAADAARKWVTVNSGVLSATDGARNRLIEIGEGHPLNVLTILGAARQGKSFLMNALTGSDDVFRVSPDVVPCTAGADLSPIIMSLSDFERGGGGSNNSHGPKIAFVDMEGQGDQSSDHDVRLATPFLLLSQVVIFNWLGLPNKSTILQRLVVMIKAGKKVIGREDEAEPAFGHLVLLMRDVKGKAEEVKALVMDDEDAGGLKFDEAKDVLERNRIRNGLRAAFKSITVHTMNRPHPEIGDGAVPLTEVSPGFTTSLDQLRGIIAEHLATPHTFGGEPITSGERLHDILGGLCEAVNSTGEISPPSVLEALDKKRAHEELHGALVLFDAKLDSFKGGHVLSTQETNKAISDARASAFEAFDHATQGGSFCVVKEVRKRLVKQISDKTRAAAGSEEVKRRELGTKMQNLVSNSESDIAKTALRWNTTDGNCMTESATQQQWNNLVSLKYGNLDRDIKAMVTVDGVTNKLLLAELGWALSRKQFDGLIKGTHKQVEDLNRSALEREKDRNAKEEAERKAVQLTKDNARLQRAKDAADAETERAARRERQAREEAEQRSSSNASAMIQAMMGGNNPYGAVYNPFGGYGSYNPYGGGGYNPYAYQGFNSYGGGGFNPFGGYYR